MGSGSASGGRPAPMIRGQGFRERYLLVGRPRVGMRAGLAVSLAAHVAMFGGALLYARLAPPRVVPEKPIVARLVRLGKPRDKRLLPRLPSATRPPPAASTGKTVPVPDATRAKALPREPSLKERERQALEQQKKLMQALDSLGPPPDGPTGKTPEPPVGQADGDVNGNADDAAEGDRYLALIQSTLRSSYQLPETISEKERLYLEALVFIKIGPDGRIVASHLEKSSGNAQFDDAIQTGLRKMTLPAPPPAFLARYGDGIDLHYKP